MTETTEPKYLVAVHDFKGRSEDEISLKKGDHVLVLEDDKGFGDGWFIGRNLSSKKAGLFPRVFTTTLVLPTPTPLKSPTAAGSPRMMYGNGKQVRRISSNKNYQNESVTDTIDDIDEAISEFNSSNPSYDSVLNGPTTNIQEWTPEMVKQYFESRGYESSVCDCFLRHKITGPILLELDLAYLKEIDITSFGTRFELSKEIKHLNEVVQNSFSQPITPSGSQNHGSPPTYNTSNDARKSNSSAQAPNTLMAPPTYTRQSIVVTSANGQNSYPAISGASPSFQSESSPRTPSGKDSNAASHGKKSSFDHNWVYPGAGKQQSITPKARQEDVFKTPKAQTGRVRSSTISTTEQYYYDNRAAETPPMPVHDPSMMSHHSKTFSNSSAGQHSRKSSYVEDTRLRYNTHSREASYDTVRGDQELPVNQPQHGASASFAMSEFNFLKPFTNGEIALPAVDQTAEKQSPVKETKERRRSSIMSALVKPLPLLNRESNTSAKIEEKEQEAENEKAVESENEADSGNPPEYNAGDSVPASSLDEKKPVMRASSHSNLRTKNLSTKQKTSAFQEGINFISPAEASKTADFSGWMSKRGSVVVGTWKNRFFCLKGTRLSYYTSFTDTRERGLIDITSHRVMAVGESDDKFVALYAASVGAGRYCFKVVPPAAGSKKGVTFTMPKVHYFAVDTREEMRGWMAAFMKATIDRDDTQPVISSCNTPTIPLLKAQELQAEARAKEDLLRSQAIAAHGEDFVENGDGSWLNGFGYEGMGESVSTSDSPSNSLSVRSSGTGSSNTAASDNRGLASAPALKGQNNSGYFQIPVTPAVPETASETEKPSIA